MSLTQTGSIQLFCVVFNHFICSTCHCCCFFSPLPCFPSFFLHSQRDNSSSFSLSGFPCCYHEVCLHRIIQITSIGSEWSEQTCIRNPEGPGRNILLKSPLHYTTTRPHAHTYKMHFKDTATGFYMGYNLLETPVFCLHFKLKRCDP